MPPALADPQGVLPAILKALVMARARTRATLDALPAEASAAARAVLVGLPVYSLLLAGYIGRKKLVYTYVYQVPQLCCHGATISL